MVYNTYIKCQVCGSITRIRLQIGYLEEHPIEVTCGKCGTSLSGRVMIRQDRAALKFIFDNADIVEDENADYMVECSGEFPTRKQETQSKSPFPDFSPFMRFVAFTKPDRYEQFVRDIRILNSTDKNWKTYKKVFTLFQNHSEYLIQEIQKILPKQYFNCGNDIEILRAIHMIEIKGFYVSLRKDILEDSSISNGILKLDSEQMRGLIEFLNSHDGYHLENLQALVYKIYDAFMSVYQRLIPTIAIQYYNDSTIDYDFFGSATSSYNSIKQFYLDVYEALGTLMVIPVALNNIKYRADINAMKSIDVKATSLEKYIGITKASRLHYCVDDEIYTKFLKTSFNVKLRNAIGHNDVEYDPIKQLITYYPNPQKREKSETEYLLQFENEAIQMFRGILGISEYIYRLRELSLKFEGTSPVAE